MLSSEEGWYEVIRLPAQLDDALTMLYVFQRGTYADLSALLETLVDVAELLTVPGYTPKIKNKLKTGESCMTVVSMPNGRKADNHYMGQYMAGRAIL